VSYCVHLRFSIVSGGALNSTYSLRCYHAAWFHVVTVNIWSFCLSFSFNNYSYTVYAGENTQFYLRMYIFIFYLLLCVELRQLCMLHHLLSTID